MPRISPTPGPRTATTLLLVAALLMAGCAGPPPPETGAPVGYEALRESISPADFGPLVGRRILLDPGHGGFFQGARADNGLAEADINLDVALQLRGLLEWAGAEVHMTRTADSDFLAGTDSTVAADLAFRVSIADSLQPDVFLSLHHNSNAARDPLLNETQTYYPIGDDGASLDLARAIHRHLALNLDIRPARLLPGNFYVLRHASVPAVLGEPAMISHPGVAERLTLAEARRLEAEAYFLGLLDYFADGDPAWLAAQTDTVTVDRKGITLAWTFVDSEGGTATAPGPDPASFRVTRQGEDVGADLSADGRTLSWSTPRPTDGSALVLEVRGRNLAGRATPVTRTVLLPDAGNLLEVTAVRDATGAALVSWTIPGPGPLPHGDLVWSDGRRTPVASGPAEIFAPDLAPEAPVFQPADSTVVRVRVTWATTSLPGGWTWRKTPGSPPARRWRFRNLTRTSAPVAGWTAVPVPTDGPWWWTTPGRLPLVSSGPAERPNFVDGGTATLSELAGVTVVIDPAGGGTDPDGTGPTGLIGAALNRVVAGELARLLHGLGARAVLTSTAPTATDPVAKIVLAQRAGADLFVTVGRTPAGGPAQVLHHPGSRVGEPWAAATAEALAALLPDTTRVVPSWNYLLRHTACPALEVRLPHAATIDDERRMETIAWQAAEARALLLGIVRTLAGAVPAVDPADLLTVLPGAFPAGRIDWGLWDGGLPWYPMPDRGPGLGPEDAATLHSWQEPGLPCREGAHTLEIHHGSRWQLWLVETGPVTARGRLLLAGNEEPAATATP